MGMMGSAGATAGYIGPGGRMGDVREGERGVERIRKRDESEATGGRPKERRDREQERDRRGDRRRGNGKAKGETRRQQEYFGLNAILFSAQQKGAAPPSIVR